MQRLLDAVKKIEFHTRDGEDTFSKNPTVVDACILQLIHIGETMNKIIKFDASFLLDTIDPKRIIGFRNLAAHDYLGVNIRLVQRIIFHDIPILKKVLKKLLKKKK